MWLNDHCCLKLKEYLGRTFAISASQHFCSLCINKQTDSRLVNGSSEATNKYTVHKLVQNRCSNILRSYDLITAYKSFYSLPFIHFLTLVRVQVMEEKCKQRCLDLPLQRQLRNVISPGWPRSAWSAQGSPPGWRSLKHPRWFPLDLETQQHYCELYQNHWAPNPFPDLPKNTWKETQKLIHSFPPENYGFRLEGANSHYSCFIFTLIKPFQYCHPGSDHSGEKCLIADKDDHTADCCIDLQGHLSKV